MKSKEGSCSYSSPSNLPEPSGVWYQRGREFALALLGRTSTVSDIVDMIESLSRLDLDLHEVLTAFADPNLAAERAAIRNAVVAGLAEVAVAAGGLCAVPDEADIADGWAPRSSGAGARLLS